VVGSLSINQWSVSKDEETAIGILEQGITSDLERLFRGDVARGEPASEDDADEGRRLLAKLLKPISSEI
jgi:hypothetical protein